MLAKPVTGWKRKNAADLEAAVLIRFLDFGKAVEGGADEISLFSGSNFGRHTVADFIPAHHQHTAPAQLLTGDAVEIPLFIGIVRLEVLRFTQFRADGNVSEFVNLAAVAFEQAGRGIGGRANVGKCFFHDEFPFLYISDKMTAAGWLSMWTSSLPFGFLLVIHVDNHRIIWRFLPLRCGLPKRSAPGRTPICSRRR